MPVQSRHSPARTKAGLPTWRRPYLGSVRQLQVPAAVTLFLCLALTALFPVIEYVSILRADANVPMAYPASIWAAAALIFCFGAVAYYLMMPLLLGLHAGIVAIVGSAMVMTYTMVYFTADARCNIMQSAIIGCAACPCAAASVCDAGDLGSNGDAVCETCTAWGRDTCASILATSSISAWGAIVMAPLLAVVVAMSLLLSQRIAAQKQALSQIVSECRQDVDLAYVSLQERGKISGITLEDLVSALVTMWDTADSDTRDEVRAFVDTARTHGYKHFDNIVGPPEAGTAKVAPEAVAAVPQPESESLDMASTAPSPMRPLPSAVTAAAAATVSAAEDHEASLAAPGARFADEVPVKAQEASILLDGHVEPLTQRARKGKKAAPDSDIPIDAAAGTAVVEETKEARKARKELEKKEKKEQEKEKKDQEKREKKAKDKKKESKMEAGEAESEEVDKKKKDKKDKEKKEKKDKKDKKGKRDGEE